MDFQYQPGRKPSRRESALRRGRAGYPIYRSKKEEARCDIGLELPRNTLAGSSEPAATRKGRSVYGACLVSVAPWTLPVQSTEAVNGLQFEGCRHTDMEDPKE